MLLQVGDFVVHPAHGVGHVVRLEEKQFAGAEARLYYEVATLQKSTVWVPVEVGASIGLRPLTAKGDLVQYRGLLRSRPGLLNQDHRQRRLELAGRLKQGSFRIVCEVVRDLAARGWRKPLSEADNAVYRKVRENLYQEWATAEGVSITEAAQEVESLLRESRQAFMV